MTIQELLSTLNADLPQTDITLYPAASEQLIQQLEAALGLVLPADFREFYTFCNGFESAEFLFHMTPIEEIIHFKEDYQPHQFLFAEYAVCVDFWIVEITPGSRGYRMLGQHPDGEMVFLTDSLALFIARFLQGGVLGLVDWLPELID
ncbi:SMI1/KNR4 family protein [Hymenobacter rubripertinctus]|uniref:SMI1/KNR4 family protein n=1 Tax=Hymenobacter rubripertinctus TaxID=2029981 RepID=A0A418R7K1_9BACT|nr:SMI1/KNR4 family protein [Hymenobacter rubripertinctus]RIY13457.1 SMI1/KNR4 family protein [Hymenobacter rubripertinctus]